jgi:hypothetical protein
MAKLLYMVIERFKGGDAVPVYRRFRDHGRLAPEGLSCPRRKGSSPLSGTQRVGERLLP